MTEELPPKCGAELHIADDHGDNEATLCCQLTPGHPGRHREQYCPFMGQEVAVEWFLDERQSAVGGGNGR